MVDAISRYSFNVSYSFIYGRKTLKKPKDKNNNKPNNKFENKGQYIDIKI